MKFDTWLINQVQSSELWPRKEQQARLGGCPHTRFHNVWMCLVQHMRWRMPLQVTARFFYSLISKQ